MFSCVYLPLSWSVVAYWCTQQQEEQEEQHKCMNAKPGEEWMLEYNSSCPAFSALHLEQLKKAVSWLVMELQHGAACIIPNSVRNNIPSWSSHWRWCKQLWQNGTLFPDACTGFFSIVNDVTDNVTGSTKNILAASPPSGSCIADHMSTKP